MTSSYIWLLGLHSSMSQRTTVLFAHSVTTTPHSPSPSRLSPSLPLSSFYFFYSFTYICTDLVFNNYGIYGPQRSAACKWPTPIYHMAWDADGAWEADLEISSPSPHLPLPPTHPFLFRILSMTYIYGYATYNTGIQYFWNLRTVKRFLTVDDFVVLLQQKMEYLVKGPLTPANISALTNLYKYVDRIGREKEGGERRREGGRERGREEGVVLLFTYLLISGQSLNLYYKPRLTRRTSRGMPPLRIGKLQ